GRRRRGAGGRSGAGEEGGRGEEGRDEAGPPGPRRLAEGALVPAAERAHEGERGEVRRGDEEEQPDGAGKQEEEAPRPADDLLGERKHAGWRQLAVRLGVEARELLGDARELGARARDVGSGREAAEDAQEIGAPLRA